MRASHHGTSRTGFTLIELLMVIVLISILSGMAIPRMSTSRFRADAAMRSVQLVLQQAQRAAIQQQTDIIVSFDTVQGRIRVVYDKNNNRAIDAGEEVRWKSLEEGNKFTAPPKRINGSTGVAIVGPNVSTFGDGLPTVYYRRDGAVSSDFEVYMRPSTSSTVADFRGISVTQATGRVELYRLTEKQQWQRGSL
jgi:prepilin-type N-terminal cleavage/methylation domain-containing protein